MARDDPTIYLRIPADLKEKLDQEALNNRRSLTSEVVARLNESFEGPRKDVFDVLQRETEAMLAALTAQVQMQQMRIDLARVRLDGLFMKRRALEAESRELIAKAKTDRELKLAAAAGDELHQVLSDAASVEVELVGLAKERDETIAQLEHVRQMVDSARTGLEESLKSKRRAHLDEPPAQAALPLPKRRVILKRP